LDEKIVTVIIELGRRQPEPGLIAFNCMTRKYLEEEGKWKLSREEGRMWVFIRPRGGQDCYLLTCEIRGDLEFCPIHRFDGMDQNLKHWSGTQRKMIYEKKIVHLHLGKNQE
jgi:hypothetical protein